MNWFAIFLYLYALGIWAGTALVPVPDLGRYFFRFMSIMAMALAIGATGVGQPLFHGIPEHPNALFTQISAIAFSAMTLLVSFVVRVARRDLKQEMFYLPVSLGAVFTVFVALSLTIGKPWMTALWTCHLLTSAALLGSSMVAMIVGHWYLQNASLSFGILIKLSKFFLGAAIAKTVVSAIWFFITPMPPLLSSFEGMLVLLRIGAGLVAPIAFGYMTLTCAKMKANQSATGILYVAVVFVLVGEVVSMYQSLAKGLPL